MRRRAIALEDFANDTDSQLEGRKTTIFYNGDADSVSKILIQSFPLKALKTFCPQTQAALQKCPSSLHCTITGGNGEPFKVALEKIIEFCMKVEVHERRGRQVPANIADTVRTIINKL